MRTRRTAADNSPLWMAVLAMWAAYYQHSPWFTLVASHEQIDTTTPASLLELYEMRLSDVDDLVVVVVGDHDHDTVADLATRYIGTLPAGAPDSFVDHNPGFPPGIQRITIPVDADAGETGLAIVFRRQSAGHSRIGSSPPMSRETSWTTCSTAPCEKI